jgi:hypothetical protein
MYNSIILTNDRNCNSKDVYYKFTLVLDKVNWQTTATLKVMTQEYIVILPGNIFFKVLEKIKEVMKLPYDPQGKVYDGPELKLTIQDKNLVSTWSNITNPKCEFNKAFQVNDDGEFMKMNETYTDTVNYLINLSSVIFQDQIGGL